MQPIFKKTMLVVLVLLIALLVVACSSPAEKNEVITAMFTKQKQSHDFWLHSY